MNNSYKFWIITLLLSFWVMSVSWSFLHHFPMTNLIEIGLNGFMLLILLVFFTSVGRRVLRLFHIAFTSFAEAWCFSFGIGSGVMIVLMLGLSAIGLLYEALIIPLVLALFLLVYQDAKQICIQGYNTLVGFSFRARPVEETMLLLVMGFAGITTFLAAATPPFFYDALVYHLAVPHKYLLTHGFHYIPHQQFSNFPMNLGMLFLVAMSFSGGILAQLLSWSYAPLTALAVYGFAKARWGEHIAITAAAIAFLIPGPLIISTLTSVECAVMFYTFLSVWALCSWFTSSQTRWIVCSAILCSLAIGTKYQAIAAFCGIEVVLFVHAYWIAKHSWRNVICNMILFGLIVLGGLSPWLIKNMLYTGNPMYPFFSSQVSQFHDYAQLASSAGNPLLAAFYALLHSSPFTLKPWFEFAWMIIKTPWIFTLNITGAAGKTGVVFLLCLPGLLLIQKKDRTIQYLLGFSGCVFGFWVFLLPWIQRYGFAMLPALSIVIAYILWHISVTSNIRRIIVGGISALLLYNLMLFLVEEITILRPFTYLFANASKEEFLLEHGVNYYPVIQSEIPKDAKILFVGEARGYYCERDYLLYSSIAGIDDREIPLRKLILESSNIQELLQNLHRLGITHILVNGSEMQRLTKAYLPRGSYFGFQAAKDQEMLRVLFSPQYSRLLISKYQVSLYEILCVAQNF
jgi:hypothetical protein